MMPQRTRKSAVLFVVNSVLVTFLAIFTSADVKVESNGVGLRQHSLDGKVSNHHLLFQADVSTKLACATASMKYATCVAFSTSPKGPSSKKMTCRGHDSKSISRSSTVAIPGSKTYFIKNRESESSWLERPCATDLDCPSTVANVTCFPTIGQCLCEPGYYYSHSLDECIADCALDDLTTMFLKYPGYTVYGYNLDTINCNTIEEGLQGCMDNSKCRTVEIELPICYLASVTPLTPGVNFDPYPDEDYFQRTCL